MMSRTMTRALMVTVILSCIGVASGCTYRGKSVPYRDLSGPFFKKDIGCTIYFVFHPEHETEGLKRYIHPISDLYAIEPDGKLERQYVPNDKVWVLDFALSDYQYPIIIWDGGTRINILENRDQVKNSFSANWFYMEAVPPVGEKALVVTVPPNQEVSANILAAIDLTSGEFVFTAETPWDFTDWSCGGVDTGLRNVLAMHKAKEGSYDKEMRTWWEPYLFHLDDEHKLTYKMIQFPPPEPKGENEVIMIPNDGRIIGVTHDGQTARFYQSLPPYDESTLLLSLKIPPVEIKAYNRDGSKLCLAGATEGSNHHYRILDMHSGRIVELFVSGKEIIWGLVALSPKGDRLAALIISVNGPGNRRFTFSVYDTLSGELIDSAEWPYKGSIYPMKVGY